MVFLWSWAGKYKKYSIEPYYVFTHSACMLAYEAQQASSRHIEKEACRHCEYSCKCACCEKLNIHTHTHTHTLTDLLSVDIDVMLLALVLRAWVDKAIWNDRVGCCLWGRGWGC